ncbi:hypothetical protein [Nocardia camponoti]|uniref:Secreted protein n=1 Tax=Nocardia camponoti TaxID=1616106 RepID=A0A917VB52_9NOCA|nr:hypothetical protein [Nocardia camponoti]GGK57730.1 hypothetical protein GCM10011591_32360 [Nocardia camponoti]
MRKFITTAALCSALVIAPIATANAATTPSTGSTGSADGNLMCSPIAQFLFSTGSVEKPPLYDFLCFFS